MKKMKILMVVLIALLGAALVFMLGGIVAMELDTGNNPNQEIKIPEQNTSTPEQGTNAPEQNETVQQTEITVQTPYGVLVYPAAWGETVSTDCVSESPYTVRFYSKTGAGAMVPLYDVIFDGTEGTYFAAFLLESGKAVRVNVFMHEADAGSLSETDAQAVRKMQQELKSVKLQASLSWQEDAVVPVPPENVPTDGIVIQTPYGSLTATSAWQEYLQVKPMDETPYRVEFWCTIPKKEPELLYQIVFGEAEGECIGTINTRPVTICFSGFIPDETWTDAEQEIAMALSEEVEQIKQLLMAMEGFRAAE